MNVLMRYRGMTMRVSFWDLFGKSNSWVTAWEAAKALSDRWLCVSERVGEGGWGAWPRQLRNGDLARLHPDQSSRGPRARAKL